MSSGILPVGCLVRIDKPALQVILDQLLERRYHVVGPTVVDGAVIYADLSSIDEMPRGLRDEQAPASYRLVPNGQGDYFSYVVGPHSLKNYLFPARTTLFQAIRTNSKWHLAPAPPAPQPLAVIGARPCDLKALEIQDRVFLREPYADTDYQRRRENLFVLAVNCGHVASTCFCTAMDSGPAVTQGADLSLFELPDHFVLEVVTERGGEILAPAPWRPCSAREVAEAMQVPRRSAQQISRRLDTHGLRDALLDNLEHDRWERVGARCLSCANCTMVCPTCFCSGLREGTDLAGEMTTREREWDSCFNDEHSYMSGGPVRKSTRARYRQWLTHKLAGWIDQFGISGCVGCGRCITWCPVGIDLTEEVAALREGTP